MFWPRDVEVTASLVGYLLRQNKMIIFYTTHKTTVTPALPRGWFFGAIAQDMDVYIVRCIDENCLKKIYSDYFVVT